MIVVYPMLTSDSISQNVLPGVCKALERFIIVYRLDTVLKRVDKQINIKFNIVGKNIQVKEGTELLEVSKKGTLDPKTAVLSRGDEPEDKGVKIKGYVDTSPSGKSEAKIDYPNKSDLTLEPTYITVNTKSGPALIGVKVLPFPIKTKGKVNVVELMENDRQMKAFLATMKGMGRYVIRFMHGAWRSTIGRFPLLTRTISGDPKKDIIYASSQFGVDTFILLNMMDIKEAFLKSPSLVKKLHYMGWRSFAVSDEVNRRVSFCMKEFGGVCNVVPYSYLFSSLGGDQKRAFDDLEDVRKSTAAFFKQKIPRKKLLGEQLVNAKLDKINNLSEAEIVHEGIADFIKSFGKKKISDVSNAANKADSSTMNKVLKSVPDININKIKSYGNKTNPDFQKSYAIAKKVVDNSLPDIDEPIRDHVSTAIAFKAISRQGDITTNTKLELKLTLPVIMRALKSGASTAAWLTVWGLIVSTSFLNMPLIISVTLIIIARGIYKFAKSESKIDKVEDKHKRKLEVMAMDAAKERSKVKVPFVNVQTLNTPSGGQ